MNHLFGTQELQDSLPENAKQYFKDYEITDMQKSNEMWSYLKDAFISEFRTAFNDIKLPFISLIILVILVAAAESMVPSNSRQFISLFICVQILVLTVGESKSFFSNAVDAIAQLYDFSTVLLPCISAAALAAGASISAGVKYTAAALFMNILLNFANLLLVPVISAYLVMMSGGCIFQQQLLSTLGSILKKSCRVLLTGTTLIFTAYLNIAGLISSTNDILASRVTKSIIASTLPVVGNIISNASSSLVAGAALLRNCIGIFGMLAVIGTLLTPFATLAVRYILILILGYLAELFPNKTVSDLIKGIGGAYGMMLGTLGTGFILIFMTLISFMQMTGGV